MTELHSDIIERLTDNEIDEAFVRRYVTVRKTDDVARGTTDTFLMVWAAHGPKNTTFSQPLDWTAIKRQLRRTLVATRRTK